MGTNFYWVERNSDKCPSCGRFDEGQRVHIGKSSYGWAFQLHVIPEDSITGLDDWERIWSTGAGEIFDEYGEKLSLTEMKAVILERGNGLWCKDGRELMHADPSGDYCIGNFPTYDLSIGEFT